MTVKKEAPIVTLSRHLDIHSIDIGLVPPYSPNSPVYMSDLQPPPLREEEHLSMYPLYNHRRFLPDIFALFLSVVVSPFGVVYLFLNGVPFLFGT